MCFLTIQVTSVTKAYIVKPDLTTNYGEISQKLHSISAPPWILPTKFPTLLSIVRD